MPIDEMEYEQIHMVWRMNLNTATTFNPTL